MTCGGGGICTWTCAGVVGWVGGWNGADTGRRIETGLESNGVGCGDRMVWGKASITRNSIITANNIIA